MKADKSTDASHTTTTLTSQGRRSLLCKALASMCRFTRQRRNRRQTEGLLPEKPEALEGRHTLILDLDETLVYVMENRKSYTDLEVTINEPGDPTLTYIQLRPGLSSFLDFIYPLYEVVIFTSALQSYAEPICKAAGITEKTHWRLYRNHCSIRGKRCVKDLSLLGRDLSTVAIIDNTPDCYEKHPENAIPIVSWTGEQFDCSLSLLMPMLKEMSTAKSVPDFIASQRRPPSQALTS